MTLKRLRPTGVGFPECITPGRGEEIESEKWIEMIVGVHADSTAEEGRGLSLIPVCITSEKSTSSELLSIT